MTIRKSEVIDRTDLRQYVTAIVNRMARRDCSLDAIMAEVDRCCADFPSSLTAYGMNPREYCDWACEDHGITD